LVTNAFRSTYRNRPVSWVLGLPPDQASPGLPVALVLHGRGGDANSAFDSLGLHGFLADHVAGGGAPFALVSIDGGDGYWHPRANGDDPLGMVVHELVPRLLSDYGLRTDQILTTGWSMGGYGALLLARESGRDALGGSRVVAAAALSPALFPSYAESSDGAFDDSADFASWGDLIADPGVSSDIALMVSCGDTDAFTDASREYRDAVQPAPAGGITHGCHDASYWRSQAGEVIAFLGANLPT
jgi:S-formylglutathione hydrolase FrmB